MTNELFKSKKLSIDVVYILLIYLPADVAYLLKTHLMLM